VFTDILSVCNCLASLKKLERNKKQCLVFVSFRPEIVYARRTRTHNKTLICKTSDLNDRSYLISYLQGLLLVFLSTVSSFLFLYTVTMLHMLTCLLKKLAAAAADLLTVMLLKSMLCIVMSLRFVGISPAGDGVKIWWLGCSLPPHISAQSDPSSLKHGEFNRGRVYSV